MSCDRRCMDEGDPDFGREECDGCPGADDGSRINNDQKEEVMNDTTEHLPDSSASLREKHCELEWHPMECALWVKNRDTVYFTFRNTPCADIIMREYKRLGFSWTPAPSENTFCLAKDVEDLVMVKQWPDLVRDALLTNELAKIDFDSALGTKEHSNAAPDWHPWTSALWAKSVDCVYYTWVSGGTVYMHQYSKNVMGWERTRAPWTLPNLEDMGLVIKMGDFDEILDNIEIFNDLMENYNYEFLLNKESMKSVEKISQEKTIADKTDEYGILYSLDFRDTGLLRHEAIAFLVESNKIEQIEGVSPETAAEFDRWMQLDILTIDDVKNAAYVMQSDARLRDSNNPAIVQVKGSHTPPPPGDHIPVELQEILTIVNETKRLRRDVIANLGSGATRKDILANTVFVRTVAFSSHLSYERLHPFNDCNGRTGRWIWKWLMGDTDGLSFLEWWYYETFGQVGHV